MPPARWSRSTATTGRPASPSPATTSWNAIVWLDHRAAAEAEECHRDQHRVLDHVGGVMSPEMEIPKLMWLKRHCRRLGARRPVPRSRRLPGLARKRHRSPAPNARSPASGPTSPTSGRAGRPISCADRARRPQRAPACPPRAKPIGHRSRPAPRRPRPRSACPPVPRRRRHDRRPCRRPRRPWAELAGGPARQPSSR